MEGWVLVCNMEPLINTLKWKVEVATLIHLQVLNKKIDSLDLWNNICCIEMQKNLNPPLLFGYVFLIIF